MENINLDYGYTRLSINNDPNKILEISLNDIAILERFETAYKKIKEIGENAKDIEIDSAGKPIEQFEETAKYVRDVTNQISEQIDYVFGGKVSEIVFDGKSPLALVKGVPLYIQFFDVIGPVLKKVMEQQAKLSEKKIAKYTEQMK